MQQLFAYVYRVADNSSYLQGFYKDLSELIYVKPFAQCLAHICSGFNNCELKYLKLEY